MQNKGYYLLAHSFHIGDREYRSYDSLKCAIKYAKNLIKDDFDKVTIYDETGVVNRIYYNVNGQARRL